MLEVFIALGGFIAACFVVASIQDDLAKVLSRRDWTIGGLVVAVWTVAMLHMVGV